MGNTDPERELPDHFQAPIAEVCAASKSSTVTFHPTADRLVVKMDPLDKMERGLYIPDRVADWTAYGTVIAVGPGKIDERGRRVPMALAVGDRVVFDWRPSHEELAMRKYCGERTILLREDEIAGVLEVTP